MAVITISRQFGCGGEYVAERVAEKLGFRFMHKELIKYIAILMETDEEKVKKFDEEHHSSARSFFSKFIDTELFSDMMNDVSEKDRKEAAKAIEHNDPVSFFDVYSKPDVMFDSTSFNKVADMIIRKLADETNCVIMGRGGQCVLADHENALHLRLIAPFEDRVTWVKNREKVGKSDAVQLVKDVDKRKRNYIKHYYNADIDDYHIYHAILNMKKLDIEQTALSIAETAKIKFKL
ncbi:AAA family ATPase [Limisalsivibrio acetivorans]|uniref:cytidylate kinase-like family protein n=1 Tax=Limisalsivibrio acetivorans TaxID=1304888 RepID=UPI0003B402DB|nr:cytidylate kinase-like family protein [Limisalsivibrio acetivorans]